ncbi:hypothetical protein EF405_11015 [Cyclobacteriaceae bacterium YHN15]|nr:hypothetical protein EF405_11015 [Cyclobacteriaceae bacterium YHN15]
MIKKYLKAPMLLIQYGRFLFPENHSEENQKIRPTFSYFFKQAYEGFLNLCTLQLKFTSNGHQSFY